MARKWFVRMGESEIGPLTTEQLKKLAADGRVQPRDAVKLGAAGQWAPARKVRGLFEANSDADVEFDPAEFLGKANAESQHAAPVTRTADVGGAGKIAPARRPSRGEPDDLLEVQGTPKPRVRYDANDAPDLDVDGPTTPWVVAVCFSIVVLIASTLWALFGAMLAVPAPEGGVQTTGALWTIAPWILAVGSAGLCAFASWKLVRNAVPDDMAPDWKEVRGGVSEAARGGLARIGFGNAWIGAVVMTAGVCGAVAGCWRLGVFTPRLRLEKSVAAAEVVWNPTGEAERTIGPFNPRDALMIVTLAGGSVAHADLDVEAKVNEQNCKLVARIFRGKFVGSTGVFVFSVPPNAQTLVIGTKNAQVECPVPAQLERLVKYSEF